MRCRLSEHDAPPRIAISADLYRDGVQGIDGGEIIVRADGRR